MAINVDVLSVSSAKLNGNDILAGTRVVSQMVSDNVVVLDSLNFTGSNDSNTITNIDGDVQFGTIVINVTITEVQDTYDYTKFIKINELIPSFSQRNGQVFTFIKENVNINAFDIVELNVYNVTNVEMITKVGVAQVDSVKITSSQLPYSYVTPLTNVPWKMVQASASIDFNNSFTVLNDVTLVDRLLNTSTILQKGDFISIDKEVFTYVSYVDEEGFHLDDVSEYNDGVTQVVMTERDVKKLNFVQDFRDGFYTYGLRDALINNAVGEIIYGALDDEIIVDAGEGGQIIVGSMYTIGEDSDMGATDKFEVHTSDDGVTWTLIYENLERRTYNRTHTMSGQGRFLKIVFKEESLGWGRIHTNLVNNKFWELEVIHPQSVLYKFNANLTIANEICKPDYIEYFDDLTTNKMHFQRTYIDSYQPEIISNNITDLELQLWYEIEGLV